MLGELIGYSLLSAIFFAMGCMLSVRFFGGNWMVSGIACGAAYYIAGMFLMIPSLIMLPYASLGEILASVFIAYVAIRLTAGLYGNQILYSSVAGFVLYKALWMAVSMFAPFIL